MPLTRILSHALMRPGQVHNHGYLSDIDIRKNRLYIEFLIAVPTLLHCIVVSAGHGGYQRCGGPPAQPAL